MNEGNSSLHFAVALAVVVLIFCLAVPATARKPLHRDSRVPITAKVLLARVASKYKQLKCYEDEGIVITIFTESSGQRAEIMPFPT
jgi:hypothetical protein